MKTNIHLVTIDPQNDFCDPKGSLFVAGADQDMNRLASFITRMGDNLDEIHCTLDSHQTIHIAHPIFWINSKNEHPGPFTIITVDDVTNGTWRTTHPGWQKHGIHYVTALAANQRYALCIWPPHCRIGTWGHGLFPAIAQAMLDWEAKFNKVDFVVKGSNPLTEHYSAVMADVPDDADPTTRINTRFLDVLAKADQVFFTGEALSHCVANTVTDVCNNFGEDNIKKIILLKDTSSNVTGFDKLGEDFIKAMTARGMQTALTTDF